MMTPNNQLVFKVFDTDYDELGEMFEGLSVDDVLDGMEGQQDFVSVAGVERPLGFDRERNSIAVLDDSGTQDNIDAAVALVKRYARGELTCSPSNADKPSYIALVDGNSYTTEYWA